MFKKQKKAPKKNGVVCVSFWIDKKTLENYKERYPRTLSQVVRYYLKQAIKDERIVKKACFVNTDFKNSIFNEED